MTQNRLFDHPHRRFNPLSREWVLVSPHRLERPWQGLVEKPPQPAPAAYDPQCYLCPGNARAGGARNPHYKSTFVFDNDYAALRSGDSAGEFNNQGLMVAQGERGICRVACFSERHDLTLALMTEREIRRVVDLWLQQYREFAGMPWINHVQIFENRGAIMGASNPHPHCQIWGNATLPNQAEKEYSSQLEHHKRYGSCLLCDYLQLELEQEQRIVCRNQHFVVLVPFWAIWPFEVMLLSVRHLGAMDALTETELDSLAEILGRLCVRYDNLFEVPFPYTMGFHQRPTDSGHPEWHFHAHYYPPLLRSATVPKFMVGFEMLGSPQRDLTPEVAADRLRALTEVHYNQRRS
jgi:UDPglucose--hexose-1-phosphate uridylyltransferase